MITAYLARYPEVSVDLRTGNLMIDLVQEGFDLEITLLLPSDPTLVRRFLARVPLMLCCAPAYLEEHAAPQSPADLAVTTACGMPTRRPATNGPSLMPPAIRWRYACRAT